MRVGGWGSSGWCRRGWHAFTLLELLVVIGIVGWLCVSTMTALSRGKGHARGVLCLGNLKQWGVATQIYAMDHDDRLPPEGDPSPDEMTRSGWYIQLPQVLGLAPYGLMPWRTNPMFSAGGTIYACPSNPRRSNGRNLFHYCLNERVDGTGTNDGGVQRLGLVSEPGVVVWMFDNGGLAAVARENNVHTNLHSRGAQFLFLDGHAKRFRNTAYWDFTARRGRTNNSEIVWAP